MSHYAILDSESAVIRIVEQAEPPFETHLLLADATVPPRNSGNKLVVNAGALTWVDGRDLTAAKEAKRNQINDWRAAANSTYFVFAGKQIQVDRVSKEDIAGVTQEVSLTGVLPFGFPGGWKARDNSYVAIPDVATWKSFVQAMVSQGSANFARSQALKAEVDSPNITLEQLDAMTW